ncbi:MAG: PQQ-binding-like beta-propeller repeat protein [Thermoanaerobaculia bacterium]|nr:PQQ-binding-like beta-propeller repeat protein [Thermoanaerobaculia bacterium]
MSRRLLCSLALASLVSLPLYGDEWSRYWPTWRGPTGNGVAPLAHPPLTWSETENVRWKVEIPGLGLSSPIVWEDRVFLTSAAPIGEEPPGGVTSSGPAVELEFVVLALARDDGRTLWRRVARTQVPHEGHHGDNSWASGSPVTDGEIVVAHFGSFGTYAYDLDGELLWATDLGDMETRRGFGEGTSPSIAGDRVIVNWDHEGDSFIVALDKHSGEEVWRRRRPDEVTSWATPLVVEHGGRRLAIVPATGRSRAYDVATGEEIWSLPGMTLNTIPSPVERDGVVYMTSGFRGNMLQAVALDRAHGDLTSSPAVLWTFDRDTPYVASPLLYGDLLYFVKRLDNILTCLDADTGEIVYDRVRIADVDNVWSSPVGADGRIYVTGRDGTTVVLEHGREYRVLAVNRIDDRVDATPALVDGEVYLRGRDYLYAIAVD